MIRIYLPADLKLSAMADITQIIEQYVERSGSGAWWTDTEQGEKPIYGYRSASMFKTLAYNREDEDDADFNFSPSLSIYALVDDETGMLIKMKHPCVQLLHAPAFPR